MTTAIAKTPAAPPIGHSFFQRYRFQISIISLLLILYVVFIVGDPRTYLAFNIYRSFMISIPFFGIMAMAATLHRHPRRDRPELPVDCRAFGMGVLGGL